MSKITQLTNESFQNRTSGFLDMPQPPVLWIKFSKEENENILKQCLDLFENHDKEKTNKDLAGNIEHEYKCPPDLGNWFLREMSQAADSVLNDPSGVNKIWRMNNCWINFQKKYEFNPLHHHYGMFSFVYWVQIPYNIKEELELKFVKDSNNAVASMFSICYTDLLGKITQKTIPLGQEDEGMALLFPAKLSHQVYPFYTSDDYRISISGNITFDVQGAEPGVVPELF